MVFWDLYLLLGSNWDQANTQTHWVVLALDQKSQQNKTKLNQTPAVQTHTNNQDLHIFNKNFTSLAFRNRSVRKLR